MLRRFVNWFAGPLRRRREAGAGTCPYRSRDSVPPAEEAILEIYGAVQSGGEAASDAELHEKFERAVADEVVRET